MLYSNHFSDPSVNILLPTQDPKLFRSLGVVQFNVDKRVTRSKQLEFVVNGLFFGVNLTKSHISSYCWKEENKILLFMDSNGEVNDWTLKLTSSAASSKFIFSSSSFCRFWSLVIAVEFFVIISPYFSLNSW